MDAICRRGDLMLIMADTNHLAIEGAHCMMLRSTQTFHAECQMESVRTVELRVLQRLSTSEIGAPMASVMNESGDCGMASIVLEC